jgi:hypothetical protein
MIKPGYGARAGSVSQRYGSENPDLHPDPYHHVTDPKYRS